MPTSQPEQYRDQPVSDEANTSDMAAAWRKVDPETIRQVAQSFGAEVERYDRTRPPYPAELIDRVTAAMPGKRVLDVGCGTGIIGRQLRAAGCEVLGVEPDERMAEFARGTGLNVESGTLEKWEPAGRTFDAVVAGQSWHWVDPAEGTRQAARVLVPGGLFAALWHAFPTPEPIAVAFGEAYRRVAPDSPFQFATTEKAAHESYQGTYDYAAGGIRAAGAFSEPEQWNAYWEADYSTNDYLDLVRTQSAISRLTPDQRDEVLDAVGAAIDALGGSFTMKYRTIALAAVRL